MQGEACAVYVPCCCITLSTNCRCTLSANHTSLFTLQAFALACKQLCVDCSQQVCVNCQRLCSEEEAEQLHFCAGCNRPVHISCRSKQQVFSHAPEEDAYAGTQRTCSLASVYKQSWLSSPCFLKLNPFSVTSFWPLGSAVRCCLAQAYVASEKLCAASVTVLLRAGRIWCSSSCQNINICTENLVTNTLHKGLAPSPLPATFGVTYTRGNTCHGNTNVPRILSAAAELLYLFKNDRRYFTGLGWRKLVPMFLKHGHPMWCYNNAVTLTLWALVPGRDVVDLQVIRLTHSPACSCTMSCPALPYSALQMCMTAID